jgi:hypothetical protein
MKALVLQSCRSGHVLTQPQTRTTALKPSRVSTIEYCSSLFPKDRMPYQLPIRGIIFDLGDVLLGPQIRIPLYPQTYFEGFYLRLLGSSTNAGGSGKENATRKLLKNSP